MSIELPASAFQTFSLRRPHTEAFWRKATCEEANCQAFRYGWETRIDLSTELGQSQAAYIVKQSGRSFSQEREDDMITFTFTPGQPCFQASEHRVAIEREPLYIVRNGTVSTAAGQVRQHTRGADWVENFQEELGKVAEDRERG